MAASMRNLFLRSIASKLMKLKAGKHYTPVATYCEKLTDKKSRFKFDIESLEKADSKTEEEEAQSAQAPAIDSAEPESFASMFRKSAFVQLGDTREKAVAGRIFDVIDDDLYIDFGGKFYCVCPRPSYQSELYIKGQRVKLMMNKFEMSTSFLGSDKHVTLLEADCTLMGLFDPPARESRTAAKENVVPGGYAEKMLAKDSDSSRSEQSDRISSEGT